VCISQLSLVDLAGSERTSRTKNSGQRLREAGTCVEHGNFLTRDCTNPRFQLAIMTNLVRWCLMFADPECATCFMLFSAPRMFRCTLDFWNTSADDHGNIAIEDLVLLGSGSLCNRFPVLKRNEYSCLPVQWSISFAAFLKFGIC